MARPRRSTGRWGSVGKVAVMNSAMAGGDFVRWSTALMAVGDSCTDQGAAASGSGFPSSTCRPVLAVGDVAAYLAAARMHGAAPAGPGIATAGTPGVPSWLASQGNAAAKACDAKGQSCLPGRATTAHLMPLAVPNAHSEFAAAA